MASFTLSGFPLDAANGGFIVPAASDLDGAFSIDAVVSATNELTPTGAVTGLVVRTTSGEVVGTAALLGDAAAEVITGGTVASFQALDGGFRDTVGGVESGALGVSFLWAIAELGGSLVVEAELSGEAVGTAAFEGQAAYAFGPVVAVNGTDNVSLGTPTLTGDTDDLRDRVSAPYVYLDGTDQYLYGTNPSDTAYGGGQAAFTAVVVFDPEIANRGQSGVLAAKHDAGSTEQGWRLAWDDTTGEVDVRIATSLDGSNRVDRTTAVGGAGIRTRSVVVARYDGTTLNLHVNGVLSQAGLTTTGTPGNLANPSSTPFTIGADEINSTPANFFRGAVCAVYLFDRELNASEANSITASGTLPPALQGDANLIASFRADRIRSQPTSPLFFQWLDDEDAARSLIFAQDADRPYVLVHDAASPLLFSDEWNLDFFNVAETIGPDDNLSSNYTLNSSGTDLSQNGTFRLYTPVTNDQEPEIVSGFRDYRSDVTIFVGGRKNPTSNVNVVFLEFFGIRLVYDAVTFDTFLFVGETGTPTRLEFGTNLPVQGGSAPGTPVVFVVRYNAVEDLVTLFIGATKIFEIGSTVTGSAVSNTGLRMCEAADWGGLDLTSGTAASDRRGAKVIPGAISDARVAQVIEGFAPDVSDWDTEEFGLASFRAALRAPDPKLLFGNLVTADYGVTIEADDGLPSPPITNNRDFLRTASPVSGTVEIKGLPDDGTLLTISDGTTTVVFEFDDNSTVDTPGATGIVISASVSQTLLNIRSALNSSALALFADLPVALALENDVDGGYVPLTLDDAENRNAAISTVEPNAADPKVRVTGLFPRATARGSLGLDGQPDDGDQFEVSDGANTVTFEFDDDASVSAGATAVTIGVDVTATMNALRNALIGSALTGYVYETVQSRSSTGGSTLDQAYFVLRRTTWTDPWSNPFGSDNRIRIPENESGALVATGVEQPQQAVEVRSEGYSTNAESFSVLDTLLPFVDNPYVVLEPEPEDDDDAQIPAFVNPQPVVVSVTATEAGLVTAVASAGPTDMGDARAWWEVELVPDDPTFNLRIDETDDDFSVNKTRTDTFQIPLGLSFDELRIRFVIQSQVDPDQVFPSLYVRMEGQEFDNDPPDILILPGTGDSEPPPQIDLQLSLEEQQFVVEEEAAVEQRRLRLSARSRYKTTRVFINDEDDPRIPGRNPDGFEFGLLAVIDQFADVAQNFQVHRVRSSDIGFLDLVAVEYYGAGFEDFWWAIAYANRIVDPELDLTVGQELIIPSRALVSEFLALRPGTT